MPWAGRGGKDDSNISPFSHDQARCIHPPFAECYAIQAFSIASDFDPKLMPKIQNQITMRKVCIVIQSLVSRRPNHHSSYCQDREKHYTLLTLKRRENVVYDVTNVEQHKLFGFDASRPLADMIPKRANSSNPLAQRVQSGMSARPAL